ncbi:hypothetical protein Hanom_Chr07g00654611 [Helianthus anomalus]
MVWQQLFCWMKVLTGSRFDSVGRGNYTCGVSISALEGMVLEKSEKIPGHRFTRLLKK